MHGKILKISSNDVYGNSDDRKIAVFAAFNHVKYMNKYVIFAIDGELNKKKLYYGSIHFKDNAVVIFSVNNFIKPYIDKFVLDYMNGALNSQEYEIYDISNIEKAVLVSYSEEDFDNLDALDKLSILRVTETVNDDSSNKKPIFLYFLLVLMIACLGGVSYLYFFPEKFSIQHIKLECSKDGYDENIGLYYTSNKMVDFGADSKTKEINVSDTYKFKQLDEYFSFKDNNRHKEYFSEIDSYSYDDDKLELKVTYKDNSIIEQLDEMKAYFKSEGYKCQEETYYE